MRLALHLGFLSFAIASAVILFVALPTSAQTNCLLFPSGAPAPSGFAISWDAFDSQRRLLISSNCPQTGTALTVTIGRGENSHVVWNTVYTWNGSVWSSHTLAGIQNEGWINNRASTNISAPSSASATNPFYFVGYTCANRFGQWKCGCASSSCTQSLWQIQAYKGVPPKPTGTQNCGNNMCETHLGETATSCSWDCGPVCGNNQCESNLGETAGSCSTDCSTAGGGGGGGGSGGGGSGGGGGGSGGGGSTNPACTGANCYPWSTSQPPGGPDPLPTPQRTVPVTNASELQNALETAAPGTRILVSDNTYAGNFSIGKSGTPGAPILITAANRLGPQFTGSFSINGNYIVLEGMTFRSGHVSLSGSYSRVTRNRLINATSRNAINVDLSARYGRVDHNEIGNYQIQGLGFNTNPGVGARYTWVDHNYIHDRIGGASGNLEECLQVGQTYTDSMQNMYSVIEQNLITNNLDTDDCVSIKSSGNVIRGNTLRNIKGGITLRNGSNNTVISNFVREAGAAIKGRGNGQRIIGNDVQTESIQVLSPVASGDNTAQTVEPSTNWVIAGNKGSLVVGHGDGPAAQNIRIEAHSGSITLVPGNTQNVTQSATTNEKWTPPVELQANQVGPFAQ